MKLTGDEAVANFKLAFSERRLALAVAGDINNPKNHRVFPPGKSRLRRDYEKMRNGCQFVLLENVHHESAPTDPRVMEAAGKFFREMLVAPYSPVK